LFVHDKGEQLVEFGGVDAGCRLRRATRQGIRLHRDPVRHGLMDDPWCPSDAPQVTSVDIQSHRLCSHLRWVALSFRLQNICASTRASFTAFLHEQAYLGIFLHSAPL